MGVTGIVHTGLSVSNLEEADNRCHSGANAVYDIRLDPVQPARRT